MINKSFLVKAVMPSLNRAIIARAKKRTAMAVRGPPAAHKKTNCDIKRKEAIKA